MLLPGGPDYDCGRLTPVPGPGADNHDSPNALLLLHLPHASGGRGDYQLGRPGQPDGPDTGLGSTLHHSDWRGQNAPAGSTTTTRAPWLTRNGLEAHLTASHGSGPPRRQNRTPTRTGRSGPTTTGPRSLGPCPVRIARPGSDSRTNATSDDPISLSPDLASGCLHHQAIWAVIRPGRSTSTASTSRA
jgi:hypothetical protein